MNIVNIMIMGLAFLYLSLRHCTVNVFNVSISELRPNHFTKRCKKVKGCI